MALTILGLSGALTHDPSAALYIDGKLVAAAEEERFVRDKHAKNRMPYEAAKFCLDFAGIKPSEIDAVAIPFAPISLGEKARWHYAKRYWYAPDRSLDAILTGNRRFYRYKKRIEWCLLQLGFDLKRIEIVPVEHHLAHASSAYHCSGFKDKTAILGIDGKGEYATTFFGYGENGKIHKIKEFYDPDSLGGLYGALTEFLGFEMLEVACADDGLGDHRELGGREGGIEVVGDLFIGSKFLGARGDARLALLGEGVSLLFRVRGSLREAHHLHDDERRGLDRRDAALAAQTRPEAQQTEEFFFDDYHRLLGSKVSYSHPPPSFLRRG